MIELKGPECGTMVFDKYTTEQRIKDLYKVNTNSGWAKNRLRILKEMMEDRIKNKELGQLPRDFILEEITEICNKMVTVR